MTVSDKIVKGIAPTVAQRLGLSAFISLGSADAAAVGAISAPAAIFGPLMTTVALTAGAYFAIDAFMQTPLGKDIYNQLTSSLFPTNVKDVPGIQKMILCYGDSVPTGEPNLAPKALSGYLAQLQQLADMSLTEIRDFIADDIVDKLSQNINDAGQALSDPLLSGFSYDASGDEELKDKMAQNIKDFANAKLPPNIAKVQEQGTGAKPDGTPAPTYPPGQEPSEDDRGRPVPGSIDDIASAALGIGKPSINLCDDTINRLVAGLAGIIPALITWYANPSNEIIAKMEDIRKVFLADKEEGVIADPESQIKCIAEVLRDKEIQINMTDEIIHGGDF